MRIANVSVAELNKSLGLVPSKASKSALKPGDSISGRVLFNDKGTVHIKTENGQVMRARLDGGARLEVGQDVRLTVSETSDSSVQLVIEQPGTERVPNAQPQLAAGELIPADIAPASGTPAPRAVAQTQPLASGDEARFAAQLKELGLPVTRETVGAMAKIISDNPDIGPQRAAFLAGNRISQEQAMFEAADRLLGGEGQTGRMLMQLTGLLSLGASAKGKTQMMPQQTAEPQVEAEPQESPRTPGWVKLVDSLLGTQGGENTQQTAAAQAPQTPQTPADADAVQAGQPQPAAPPPEAGLPDQAQQIPSPPRQTHVSPPDENTASPQPTAAGPEPAAPQPAAEASPPAPQTAAPAALPETTPALLLRLAGMPELETVGSAKLGEFARVLESAAREVADILAAPGGQESGLRSFIDGMFARIDRWQEDTPSLLRQAKEELFVKLSVVREAISQSQIVDRPALADHTQKLLDHMRLMEQINQFVYAQIPVQYGERQTTCELYVYPNKKGGKRIDPENARILLALDLEHMGHVQSFVTIKGKEVGLQMETESDLTADFFKSRTASLHAMLGESGYKLTENRVGVLKREVSAENALLALADYESVRKSGFDLKA